MEAVEGQAGATADGDHDGLQGPGGLQRWLPAPLLAPHVGMVAGRGHEPDAAAWRRPGAEVAEEAAELGDHVLDGAV